MFVYCTFIDRRIIKYFSGSGLKGSGKLKTINSNLENSRWMSDQERDKIFKRHAYSKLSTVNKDGIPVMAKLKNKNKLYVRAKAYKLDGKTKVWSVKWSKVKKVKIK